MSQCTALAHKCRQSDIACYRETLPAEESSQYPEVALGHSRTHVQDRRSDASTNSMSADVDDVRTEGYGTQVRCKEQASPIVQDDTQVSDTQVDGLMDTVKA
eukprot:CAMPEP_0183593494 /NCGR_PEP_ID=MMETSP0371-20130417/169910_1 /TAXON_ID=268820 /ORGANISM="Peridinium aciculiferum, Strain PAER-2" /LENGTH=101 /DNA_ID=CAMNT_0025805113 /DNA_START=113 /DNA_END=415 /DNA_ORIENTATION=-